MLGQARGGKRMDSCIGERFLVVYDFLPEDSSRSMRGDIDAHFADPAHHDLSHQVWNYWYVPGCASSPTRANVPLIF
jgi:hypothetical protein